MHFLYTFYTKNTKKWKYYIKVPFSQFREIGDFFHGVPDNSIQFYPIYLIFFLTLPNANTKRIKRAIFDILFLAEKIDVKNGLRDVIKRQNRKIAIKFVKIQKSKNPLLILFVFGLRNSG